MTPKEATSRQKRRAIAQVPRPDLLETMNALIAPRVFFSVALKRVGRSSAILIHPQPF